MSAPLCAGVVDVAHWDADPFHDLQPHLAQARADGIVGVIAKATQGKDAIDTQWARWAREIPAAGLLLGAYHFLSSSSPGEQQAAWFLDRVHDVGVDPASIVLALDYETNPDPKLQATLADARAFVREVHRQVGRWPLFYGYQSMLCAQVHDPADDLVRCPLWLAAYGSSAEKGPVVPPGYREAGKSWTLWQYTDDVYSASGLPKSTAGFKRMDRSVFRGTADQLRAAWPGFGG